MPISPTHILEPYVLCSPLATFRVVALVASKDRPALLATRSLPSIASQQRRFELILVEDSPDPLSVDRIRKIAENLDLCVSTLQN
jgi:hypothetical protein